MAPPIRIRQAIALDALRCAPQFVASIGVARTRSVLVQVVVVSVVAVSIGAGGALAFHRALHGANGRGELHLLELRHGEGRAELELRAAVNRPAREETRA